MTQNRPPRPTRPGPDTPAKPAKPAATKTAHGEVMPGERIAKVLARAGVASRRDVEKMITEGRVSVNGKVITSPALNVTGGARIVVDGKAVGEAEPARLWLYHKPTGLVTTTKDEQGRETIFDKLPEDMPRVLSVGRLDLNSEGLLLLTNDGAIKRQLELPSTGWLRRYRVRVKGAPSEAMLEPLREGIVVDREAFQPMIVTLDRQQGANAWLTIGLREGRNREIRRAMENVGLVVNRLIRVSYGPFQLGDLKVGEVEEVKRRVMRDQLGLPPEEDAPEGPRKRVVRKSRPARPAPGTDITDETHMGRPGRGGPTRGKAGVKSAPRTGGGLRGETDGRADKGGRADKPAGRAAGGKPSGGPGGARKPGAAGAGGKSFGGKVFASRVARDDGARDGKPAGPRGAGAGKGPNTGADRGPGKGPGTGRRPAGRGPKGARGRS